jgi:AcrR family transcriptional regulator
MRLKFFLFALNFIALALPFQRARKPVHRRQRRRDIVSAAAALATDKGVRNVTLADIADVVGLADSTVVRHFGVRDEIFLELSKQQWETFVDDTIELLERTQPSSPGDLADTLARSWAEHPLFCDLLGQLSVTLERHASPKGAIDFKVNTIAAVGRLAQVVSKAHPGHAKAGAASLIGAGAPLAGGYWALAHPGPSMLAAYEAHPEYAHYAIDFLPTLRHLLAALLEGLPRVAQPELGWVTAAGETATTGDEI